MTNPVRCLQCNQPVTALVSNVFGGPAHVEPCHHTKGVLFDFTPRFDVPDERPSP